MNRPWRLLTVILLGIVLTYGVFFALRARSNLHSLKVRDADARSLPLEDALRAIAQQTRSDAAAESNQAVQLRERAGLLGSLPLEQRLQAIQQQMANPEAQSRMRDAVMRRIIAGIKDTTPEQRVQRVRALKDVQRQLLAPVNNAIQ
jgi:hypothetical protein